MASPGRKPVWLFVGVGLAAFVNFFALFDVVAGHTSPEALTISTVLAVVVVIGAAAFFLGARGHWVQRLLIAVGISKLIDVRRPSVRALGAGLVLALLSFALTLPFEPLSRTIATAVAVGLLGGMGRFLSLRYFERKQER